MKTLCVALLVWSVVGAGAQRSAPPPQTSGSKTAPGAQPGPADPAAPASPAPPAGSAVAPTSGTTSLRLTGTLEEFDAKKKAIAVQTEGGTVRLALTPTTRIHQGRRQLDPSALDRLLASAVVVRYAESAGGKTVVSLHFSETAPARR